MTDNTEQPTNAETQCRLAQVYVPVDLAAWIEEVAELGHGGDVAAAIVDMCSAVFLLQNITDDHAESETAAPGAGVALPYRVATAALTGLAKRIADTPNRDDYEADLAHRAMMMTMNTIDRVEAAKSCIPRALRELATRALVRTLADLDDSGEE